MNSVAHERSPSNVQILYLMTVWNVTACSFTNSVRKKCLAYKLLQLLQNLQRRISTTVYIHLLQHYDVIQHRHNSTITPQFHFTVTGVCIEEDKAKNLPAFSRNDPIFPTQKAKLK